MACTLRQTPVTTTDYQQILQRLSDAQVNFMVIGGLAAIVHGATYVTYDVDLCYDRSRRNVENLCRALQPLRPGLRDAPANLPFRFDPDTVLNGMNFTLDTDCGAVDLFGEVQPFGPFPSVRPFADEAELFGLRILVLSLEGLILAKQAAGRRKDLLLLPELEALRALRARKDDSSA